RGSRSAARRFGGDAQRRQGEPDPDGAGRFRLHGALAAAGRFEPERSERVGDQLHGAAAIGRGLRTVAIRSAGRGPALQHPLMRRFFWLVLLCACSCSKESAWHAGQPLTLDVTSAFPAGTLVRDQSSGTTATVAANGSLTFTPDGSGVALLEKDGAHPSAFSWENAVVYFVITD